MCLAGLVRIPAQQFSVIAATRSMMAAEPLTVFAPCSIARVSQTDARASAVFVDELDAGHQHTYATSALSYPYRASSLL